MDEIVDDTPDGRLRAAWTRLVSPDTTLFDRVAARHREKHRHYHRLTHVDRVVVDVVELGRELGFGSPDLATAFVAAVYHDAVYEPRSSSNERASARLARRDLTGLGWSPDRVDAVGTMIEGTATHTDPTDTVTAVLFDADLAILGSHDVAYEAYRVAIRREYHHVDDDAWVSGRTAVLRSFLDRGSVYATEIGRQRWEEAARQNLGAELASLT